MASEVSGDTGTGESVGLITSIRVACLPPPPPHQVFVEQQGALVWRRRALEWNSQDGDQHATAGERRQRLLQSLGAGDGVVLVTIIHEARGGRRVVIGAQRHDQDVWLV